MVSEVCGLQRSMVLTSRQVVDSDVHNLQWGIWLVERFDIYSVVCVWLSCVVYCEVYLWQWGISFTVQYMVDIEVCDFQSGILLIIYFLYDKQWFILDIVSADLYLNRSCRFMRMTPALCPLNTDRFWRMLRNFRPSSRDSLVTWSVCMVGQTKILWKVSELP